MAEREWPPFQKGVACCIAMFLLFLGLSVLFVQSASGLAVLVRDSVLRAMFGAVGLYLFVKEFQKGTWRSVIHLRNFKEGLRPGAGLFLIMLLQALLLVTALVQDELKTGEGVTAQYLFLKVFFQQLTTGFWEEMNFRGFLLEGYFSSQNKTQRTRLSYAFLSFVIFGLLHIIGCRSVPVALYRFFATGAAGFIFAAMYLYSHNLLSCMVMHFVYDIFANMVNSDDVWYGPVTVVLIVIAWIFAVSYVIKVPLEERIEEK